MKFFVVIDKDAKGLEALCGLFTTAEPACELLDTLNRTKEGSYTLLIIPPGEVLTNRKLNS